MFRRTFFWLHLITGLIAGLLIAVKCITALPLAFEKELLNWSEAELRFVSVPAEAKPLELASLVAAARAKRENKAPSGIVLSADPAATLLVQFGREDSLYVNRYTGEILEPKASGLKSTLHFMEELHRFLALTGSAKEWGKGIGGASNLVFVFLALSGLILWWPRHLSWRSLKALTRVNLGLKGKARDWNWHTTLGFWATPALLVLSISAIPISYRWGANMVYTIVGETAPQQGAAAQNRGPEVPKPAEGSRRLSEAALLERAASAHPGFEQLTLRSESNGRRAPGSATGSATGPAGERKQAATNPEARPAEKAPEARAAAERSPETGAKPAEKAVRAPAQAASIQLKEPHAWPRTATTTLYLNPYTGEIMKTEAFADQSAGQRLRHWLRYLHTGEALGLPGKIAAFAACLIGVLLVYTGFALSWRRFLR